MKSLHVALGALTLGLSALPLACSSTPVSEIVVAVQTDMSLPKDIDTIQVQIFSNGVARADVAHGIPATDGLTSILLPATLGLLPGEDPSTPVTVRVIGRRNGAAGEVRVLREVVTTVPQERIVTLHVPLHFLCDGTSGHAVEDPVTGQLTDAENDCPDGETCIAGTCTTNVIDSSTLPDYAEGDVFGGGTGKGDGSCFDVAGCFDGGTSAPLDATANPCGFAAGEGVNVALSLEGAGICGASGCYVALDAETPAGFTRSGDQIALPPAVCTQILAGKILGVVTAPISASCPQKGLGLPTCGPWSAVGSSTSSLGAQSAVAIASGQAHPASLTLSEASVYWTNGGTFGQADGAVKRVAHGGGTPEIIASGQASPRDVAFGKTAILWTNADTTGGAGGSIMKADLGAQNGTAIVSGLTLPEGVVSHGSGIFWTEFASGNVMAAASDGSNAQAIAVGNYPYRIVADTAALYWTNEGTASAMPADGGIVRFAIPSGPVQVLATQQSTPRALALETAETGEATAVYWTTFAADGAVMVAHLDAAGGVTDTAPVATGLSYPNGVAVDAGFVYWTTRGDGKVWRVAKGAAESEAEVIASGRNKPGAIAVNDASIFWIDEGASDSASGSVMRLSK